MALAVTAMLSPELVLVGSPEERAAAQAICRPLWELYPPSWKPPIRRPLWRRILRYLGVRLLEAGASFVGSLIAIVVVVAILALIGLLF